MKKYCFISIKFQLKVRNAIITKFRMIFKMVVNTIDHKQFFFNLTRNKQKINSISRVAFEFDFLK